MKKHRLNRAASTAVLAAQLLMAASLISCGEDNAGNLPLYREAAVSLPDGYQPDPATLRYDGASFVCDLVFSDDGGETYYTDLNRKTLTFGTDGTILSETAAQGSGGAALTLDADGVTVNVDERLTLRFGDAVVELPRLFDYDIDSALAVQSYTPLEFQLLSVVNGDEIDSLTDGGLYIVTSHGMLRVDSSGEPLWLRGDIAAPTVFVALDGRLYLMHGEDEKSLSRVNADSGELGEQVALPCEISRAVGIGGARSPLFYKSLGSIAGADGYDFFAATSHSLLGVKLKSGGEALDSLELINWLAAGISPSEITALAFAQDGSVAVAIGARLSVLVPQSEDEAAAIETVTIASFNTNTALNRRLENAIIEYNRTHGLRRIVVRDYTLYDEEQRMTLFSANISAGELPAAVIAELKSSDDRLLSELISTGYTAISAG